MYECLYIAILNPANLPFHVVQYTHCFVILYILIFPQLSVRCLKKEKAPYIIKRGSATTDGQFVYFTLGGFFNSVYRYELNTEKWDELPPSPHCNSRLVIINGELTAVGGESKYYYTNKLFTLRQNQWVQDYPPMQIGHSEPAVVSTSDRHYIFVIGGNVPYDRNATVEVLDVKSKRWYTLSNCKLPLNISKPSATICGNQLYVIGEHDEGYTCSLQVLLSNIQLYSALLTWTKLPQLPIRLSTAATLCGELLMISGVRRKGPSKLIYQLVDGRWVKIGSTSGDTTECLEVSPLPDKLIIVGGDGGKNSVVV